MPGTARRYVSGLCLVAAMSAAITLASSSICQTRIATRSSMDAFFGRSGFFQFRVRRDERPLLAGAAAVGRETANLGDLDAPVTAAAPDGARAGWNDCQIHVGFRDG